MHVIDRLKIYFFHKNRSHNWHGLSHKMQGWSSLEEQKIRFKAIANGVDFANKRVLDLGCGLGELYDYLSKEKRLGFYLGMDQHWSFLRQAKARIGSTQCRFQYADISRARLPKMDIIIASGSLNYRSRQPDYLEHMIARMYNAATEAVIFNLLNSQTFSQPKLLQPYHKEFVMEYCKTLTPNVVVIDDYSTNDFTIVLKKTPQ
ncbi:class I SAM-dependent methyltransferase [Vibrio pectenicida]|uniref:Class I SAM-dependent methyltransferase n=1 Tax=Vibrio pectenicida TaxID=62763 RepID=A0A7Y3ZW43_9VIBR|nr:class I SAM-dependent methyltransferase [Vibrio pectenicida]NOH70225.1 class I SAM-dependent methyltransferase [Vibrio pectenicida]